MQDNQETGMDDVYIFNRGVTTRDVVRLIHPALDRTRSKASRQQIEHHS